MKLGVLALQGAFVEHINILKELDVEPVEIRRLSHFSDDLDGLIFPGGESTAISKLLNESGLLAPIKDAVLGGMPAFGTCAGMILLSGQVEGLGTGTIPVLDVLVRRNGYGRQLGSFSTVAHFEGVGDVPMVFIRAPYILEIHGSVEILTEIDGKIVAVRQNSILATAFHPELTENADIHKFFIEMIASQ
ncbi:MAG: pyridoxal 5'-phosphate synthase glutaminase subunit PdxT [Oscillospiraceae bacterium]|nr:pyridoxal 5'-phosphate synthase glutaminase subunit PdxT [Oscillospiraceae bacterium]MCL2279932.1 pyridoxal 5'-phosphate synthase glutaminase subunit PdxT [Oscillospiraceae bacterium]